MELKPISHGPRITQEEAVDTLVKLGFTTEEANQYLVEPSLPQRMMLLDTVSKRQKEGKQ